ncbi:MAG TPA: CPBP family intramembrane glutamic endopeptidase, partial [Thermoanaerobaculia bacterium]|nr:CPBP family intramembrane glutamic endopeptidase [Thermoanaerobaculia bacterium]
AIATRLSVQRNLRGLGWGWMKRPVHLGGMIAFCFLGCLLVYLPLWLSGLGAFNREMLARMVSWVEQEGARGIAKGLVLLLVLTLGEELGWRGLLAPQLSRITTFTTTSLVTGLVWALWHFPIVALQLAYFQTRVPLWYSLLCFTATVLGLSFFFTWVRLRSESLWPGVLLHGSCNCAQWGMTWLTHRTTVTDYVIFQYGAGFAVVVWILVGIFWRRLQASLPDRAA